MASSVSLRTEAPAQPAPAKPAHPKATPPERQRWKWVLAAAAVAVVLVAIVAVVAARRGKRATTALQAAPQFAPATRGPLARTVRIGGVVAAVKFSGVSAPALRGPGTGGPLSVIQLATAGSHVKKGDLLAEFERQAQYNRYEDRQAEFISLTDQIAKRRAEIDVEREKRRTDLLKARTDLDGARLENKRNEVISRIDAEKNQQTLAEAEANLKMLEQTEKLRRAAEESELRILEIRRERERLEMENSRMNYERLVVMSPIEGMVVLTPIWKGNGMGAVQEGDQVRPGIQFMQVVDAAAMVVRARVNQLDTTMLRPGQTGTVRLDAYPDLSFPAEIASMSTLAQSPGWWSRYIKTFPVQISVKGSDPRLIPDISASMDVELEQAPEAVLVPRQAVVRQEGSRQDGFVWVRQGDELKPRAVKLGPRSDTHWAILSGVHEGEMVALNPPAAEKSQPNNKPPSNEPPKDQKRARTPAAARGVRS